MIAVSLTKEMWEAALNLLAEHPYKVSAQIIHGIVNSLKEQQTKEQSRNVEPLRSALPGD